MSKHDSVRLSGECLFVVVEKEAESTDAERGKEQAEALCPLSLPVRPSPTRRECGAVARS